MGLVRRSALSGPSRLNWEGETGANLRTGDGGESCEFRISFPDLKTWTTKVGSRF